MQRAVQITFRGMEPSEAVDARVRTKLQWLEKFYGQLVGAHVVVDAPHHHSHQGNLFRVSIALSVPGGQPIAIGNEQHDNHSHEDVYVAIRDAFDAARRRLQDYADRQRGDVKRHASQL